MLHMIYGRMNCPDVILDSRVWFREHKKPEWFQDLFVQKVIKEIDGAEVLFEEALKNRYGHGISTEQISTGSKTLICIYEFPEKIFYGTTMGDNCYPLLFEIAEKQEITIMIEHCPDFDDKYFGHFTINGLLAKTRDIYYKERSKGLEQWKAEINRITIETSKDDHDAEWIEAHLL